MDLREFSARNAGCRFELEESVKAVPLKRIVLVIDDSTDQAYLNDVLQRAWHAMSLSSPNRMSTPVDVKHFRLGGFGAKKYSHLVRAICAAAGDGRTEEVSAGHFDQVVASSAG
jgi:hypothetical protein